MSDLKDEMIKEYWSGYREGKKQAISYMNLFIAFFVLVFAVYPFCKDVIIDIHQIFKYTLALLCALLISSVFLYIFVYIMKEYSEKIVIENIEKNPHAYLSLHKILKEHSKKSVNDKKT
jgi:hypothetical protein